MSSERLRVFVSYARRDAAAFAEELVAGLEVAGFEAFLDKHDIAGGEDWEARLGGLIESADTVVFVLTPASVTSERCRWEIERAAGLSKRLIPVVSIPVEEAAAPEPLRRLNYIFFDEGRSFTRSLGDLAKALRVDLDWIREHTRLSEVARRWDARDRNDVLLLRGPELEAARTWLAGWRAPAPEPTNLQGAFIAASEEAEGAIVKRERARQRRTITALSAVAALLAVLASGAAYSWFRAQAALRDAEVQRDLANVAAARAQFYEGLYWLRMSGVGGRSSDNDDDIWSEDEIRREDTRSRMIARAIQSFERGLEHVGEAEVDVDGVSLRELLGFGRIVARFCSGLDRGELALAPREVRDHFIAELEFERCR